MKFTRTQFIASLLLLGFLLSAGWNQNRMNHLRADLELTQVTPLENAPPALAFTTIALGGFRGIIANFLWIRMMRLQSQGQYFEMVLLADWITKLQPRFASVWVHQSWNLVYNISKEFQDAQDRWLWVKSGIELLRDQGLRYNPNEALLYQELAWFYQDKIGSSWDDKHLYYKSRVVDEMMTLLGSPHPNYDALLNPQTPEDSEVLAKLQTLGLDPVLMNEVDQQYGPLDWRINFTHALYWSAVGLKKAKTHNLIPLRRSLWQAMHMSFRRGRLIVNFADQTLEYGPNLEIADKVEQIFQETFDAEKERKYVIERAHRNFLKDATYFFYMHARITDAAKWYQHLASTYPDEIVSGQTLDEFAIQRLENFSTSTYDRAKAVVDGLLINSFYQLAIEEDEQAEGALGLAQKVHYYFEKKAEGQEERLGLPPLQTMRQNVLSRLLSDDSQFSPPLKARLRARLGLDQP